MTAISLCGLTRHFGTFVAVDDINFHVEAGEVVGLLGANGAGKTTTLRMLAGLLEPTRGTAMIGGHDVHTHPLEARRKLGFLTNLTGLPARLTGREVLLVFAQLAGLSLSAAKARIEKLTALLDLASFLDVRTGLLSSGQKQRIGIARAVVHDPPCLVLDEPTAALDPIASLDIAKLIRLSREEKKAVLLSTHRMDEAESWCSRLVLIHQGKLRATGSIDDLKRQSQQTSLTNAFLTLSGVSL
jgi:sodium transport system ATP-binding protein